MRIGIDATSVLDEHTGVEVHVLTVVDALARGQDGSGEYVLFVRRRPPPEWTDLGPAFSIVCLATNNQVVATQILLPRAARRAGVDVLYCPAKPAPVLGRVPVLVNMHDAVPWTRPESMGRGAAFYFRSLGRWAARRGCHVATVSEASARELIETLGLPRDRMHVIGNAVAPWLRQPGASVAWPERVPSRPYLLSLCRIEPRKDLGTVLDAWSEVSGLTPTASSS